MDNKSILMLFVALIAVFVCAFTLSLEAVENGLVMYGVYAFIGFVLIVLLSLYESMLLKKDGSSTAYWFRTLSLVVSHPQCFTHQRVVFFFIVL